MTRAAEIAGRVAPNVRQVVMALSAEYQPSPRSFSRQLTASAALRRSDLVEREWQGGCASCTYYRLTPLGLEVRAHLQAMDPKG